MPNKTRNSKIKVAVGLSGGVDSSVAAYLLKEQGYDVTGVHMVCWDYKADGCRGEEDRADAVKIADKLSLPFKTLNFEKEYKERVIQNFYDEYKAGRTPNPDVLCNKEIKFGLFLEWALEQGFDYIATGHYAKILQDASNDCYKLVMGSDNSKDQSYFLYLLGQEQLKHTLFPLGEYQKEGVRQIAKEQKFHTATKSDSVGICFVGDVDIKEFLKKEINVHEGSVVKSDGEVIGKHDGIEFYTIGQRHGFRIEKYQGIPLYVIGKNVEDNELVVGFAKDANVKNFEVHSIHWLCSNNILTKQFSCHIRIRHLGELYPATVVPIGSICSVTLESEIFGVAPGQSAVLYVNEAVLAGGIIGETNIKN